MANEGTTIKLNLDDFGTITINIKVKTEMTLDEFLGIADALKRIRRTNGFAGIEQSKNEKPKIKKFTKELFRQLVDLKKSGKSAEEIADELGISRSSVHSRLNYAKNKLNLQ